MLTHPRRRHVLTAALALAAAGAAMGLSACATGAPGLDVQPHPHRASVSTTAAPQIEHLARAAVERGVVPGLVVRIEQGGAPAYTYATGFRDIEAGAPQGVDDLFRIYSMTKPVTVATALVLVERGVLELDAPVAAYLPAFAEARVYAGGETLETLQTQAPQRPLSVRDLMRHTAGMTYKSEAPGPVHELYRQRGIDTGSGADAPALDGSGRPASARELAGRIAAIPLLHQPGAQFSYGNATDVLGAVIEAATQERLSVVMTREILEPLAMTDTVFRVSSETPQAQERMTAAYTAPPSPGGSRGFLGAADLDALTPSALTLIDPAQGGVFTSARAIDFGGAGLVSTARDTARFARMLLQGGELDGRRVLSPASVAAMTTDQLGDAAHRDDNPLSGEGLSYGLGLGVVADADVSPLRLSEGAAFWGGAASTLFWIDPANDQLGVIMTQVFGGDARAYNLAIVEAANTN